MGCERGLEEGRGGAVSEMARTCCPFFVFSRSTNVFLAITKPRLSHDMVVPSSGNRTSVCVMLVGELLGVSGVKVCQRYITS